MELLKDPAFWTAISLLLFIALLLVLNVQGALVKSLDARSGAIRTEIDEARRLRDEAQALLAEHQRRRREAQAETEDILAQARAEAEHAAQEARADLADLIERRRKQAESKIAQAEKQATKDIRAYAASVSIGAARRFISGQMDDRRSSELVDGAIATLPEHLKGR